MTKRLCEWCQSFPCNLRYPALVHPSYLYLEVVVVYNIASIGFSLLKKAVKDA